MELDREECISELDAKIKYAKFANTNAVVLLRTENANLHASCTEFERKCASLNDDNERLSAELAERPPRLVITKLQKGNNDENSKDTAALQECKADNYI